MDGLNKTGIFGPFASSIGIVDDAVGNLLDHTNNLGEKMMGIGGAMTGVGATLSAFGSEGTSLAPTVTAGRRRYGEVL